MEFSKMMLRVLCLVLALGVGIASPASAHLFRYFAFLSGASESPSNNSTGSGHAIITADLDVNEMRIEASFDGLVGTALAGQLRAATASPGSGVAIPAVLLPDFPTNVQSGAFDKLFDLGIDSTYTTDFINQFGGGSVAGAYSALISALDDGTAYFEILTTQHNGPGEVRGFLVNLVGDFNTNGIVDAADYTIWRDHLGETGEGLFADTNNDNVVDELDYDAWKQNFGRIAIVGSGSGGEIISANVPEPRGIVLLACGVSGLRWLRQRKELAINR